LYLKLTVAETDNFTVFTELRLKEKWSYYDSGRAAGNHSACRMRPAGWRPI